MDIIVLLNYPKSIDVSEILGDYIILTVERERVCVSFVGEIQLINFEFCGT